MSFIYPRTVQILRSRGKVGEGALSYGGTTQGAEDLVQADIPASIQLRREGQRNPVGLPADGSRPNWDMFTRRGVLADGIVKDRDIVVDDLGRRFFVLGDYIDSMGGKFRIETLEA